MLNTSQLGTGRVTEKMYSPLRVLWIVNAIMHYIYMGGACCQRRTERIVSPSLLHHP